MPSTLGRADGGRELGPDTAGLTHCANSYLSGLLLQPLMLLAPSHLFLDPASAAPYPTGALPGASGSTRSPNHGEPFTSGSGLAAEGEGLQVMVQYLWARCWCRPVTIWCLQPPGQRGWTCPSPRGPPCPATSTLHSISVSVSPLGTCYSSSYIPL